MREWVRENKENEEIYNNCSGIISECYYDMISTINNLKIPISHDDIFCNIAIDNCQCVIKSVEDESVVARLSFDDTNTIHQISYNAVLTCNSRLEEIYNSGKVPDDIKSSIKNHLTKELRGALLLNSSVSKHYCVVYNNCLALISVAESDE